MSLVLSTRSSRSDLYRVLVTDANFKHSIALGRYIKADVSDVHLTGLYSSGVPFARYYKCFDECVNFPSLREALEARKFDMVIPVGSKAVLEASDVCPHLAILPSAEQLRTAFDKSLTAKFAEECGVPIPLTQHVRELGDLDARTLTFPCVVKASHEQSPTKEVRYCGNLEEVRVAIRTMLDDLSPHGIGVLVQEYIAGTGHGYFALMDHGLPVQSFMHKRLREFPTTGGPSSAAGAFESPRLRELGLRLLTRLSWNGVAMVEFKYDQARADFILMEINGKFWGSLELALAAGVNFGADLIALRRQEARPASVWDPNLKFYWPLDGDLRSLWGSGLLFTGLREYFDKNARTNLGQSFRADFVKSLRLLRDLVQDYARS